MKRLILPKFKKKPYKYIQLYYIALFFLLLFIFHFLYIWWSGYLNYYPFIRQVEFLFQWASLLLLNQSTWILEYFFQIDFYVTIKDQAIHVQATDKRWTYLLVSPECTSLKQWMHWVFLIVLFPGPLKHKIWYIPMGLIIIEFVNVFRIVGLALTLTKCPQHFNFFHDYIFKTFFYFIIFFLWVIWVQIFLNDAKRPNPE